MLGKYREGGSDSKEKDPGQAALQCFVLKTRNGTRTQFYGIRPITLGSILATSL
jgi:hypothetical protein